MRRNTQQWLIRLATLTILAVLAWLVDRPASYVAAGTIRVIDGDSLMIDGEKARLLGIDAPEAVQTCHDHFGKRYYCGEEATSHLRRLMRHADISCTTTERDQYQRQLVQCLAGEDDVAAIMIRDGRAVTYNNKYVDYSADQREAKRAKRGLWAGTFDHPRDWKKQHPR